MLFMGVRPVDIITVQQMHEVTQVKNSEIAKPMAQQYNIAAHVEKKIENNAEQVVSKSDVENRNRKFDAKDKSDNEYQKKKSKQEKDGKVTIKGKSDSGFDVKV